MDLPGATGGHRLQPVIIEVAVNGVATRDRGAQVPILPDEIGSVALGCFAAGATIVHSHIDRFRVSVEEAAQRYLESWDPVWQDLPGALLYPTINGGPVEQSIGHLGVLAGRGLRIGIFDAGSVNLGRRVYLNSPKDISHQLEVCQTHRLGPSMAIFEPGFLRVVLRSYRAGQLPPGGMIKLYFGAEEGYFGGVFGLPPTRPCFDAYLSMLEGCNLPWSVALLGGDVLRSGVARWALEAGGHLRVGLEDFSDAKRGPTNEQLVAEAVALCREVGRPVATQKEVVDLLDLAQTEGSPP
jgi:uncharacterized protein (DUF849 family)